MRNNKGFSLVELIVVIAIMAILAAVAIPTFATFIDKANKGADEDFANGIEYAVDLALAGEGKDADAINVQWDLSEEKITKLTYSLDVAEGATDTTYVVIGTPGEGEVAAEEKIATEIATIIDDEYDLKTNETFTFGAVTITVVE